MLQLDITSTLAKAITATRGIPDQEMAGLRTSMRRYVEDFLKEREKGQHPWSMNPYDKQTMERVREMAMFVKGKGIKTVLWVGIGGSGLGPRVLQEVFGRPDGTEFVVVDTIDPTVLSWILSTVDWKTTLLVVVSKSGETLETMSAFFVLFEHLRDQKKLRWQEHAIAITDPENGSLKNFCLDFGIPMLPHPANVGGRYSMFTPVGLFALALLDGDLSKFLRGAKEMDTLCQKTKLDENPAALLAAVQYLLDVKRQYPMRVIMPYSTRLQSFARWNQQLIAESLGKEETHNPFPVAAIGTQDQHSLLQQWMAGPRKAWHIFIHEAEKPRLTVPEIPGPFAHLGGKTFGELLDACLQGTSAALTSVKRPHVTISLQRLDESHLGQLFFLFLTEVVFLGKLYRIDPYGQPAVEIGKKITKEILGK